MASRRDQKTTRKKDMDRLRNHIDGNDNFMNAHQVKKVRVLFGQKDTPEWATNDIEVRKVLLRSFPKLGSEKNQRQSAARWMQAITLVYRLGLPYNHAAAEMGTNVGTLRSMLRNIRRVALNLRANGSGARGATGLRPRGRPKQK
jgi:hypothetical protein